MDGVHDMGGMHGFGPIERDELSYHEDWEVRVHAMSNAMAAPGGGRYSLESLDPATYLGSSYYRRWLLARINTLVDAGTISKDEFAKTVQAFSTHPDREMPADDADAYAKAVETAQAARKKAGDSTFPPGSGTEASPNSDQATFGVGDSVRAKTIHPVGHTRLPRYVRGRKGTVIQVYRRQGFQDHEPMSDHVGPQTMYAVRFEGTELWGEQAEANSSVVLDMWEAYLEAK